MNHLKGPKGNLCTREKKVKKQDIDQKEKGSHERTLFSKITIKKKGTEVMWNAWIPEEEEHGLTGRGGGREMFSSAGLRGGEKREC